MKGNTDLVGGVISSTADASKNSLTTGTLTSRDIDNHAEYSAEQSSISASYTSANPLIANNPTALQQGVSSLAATAVGNAQRPIEGNASGTTRSAVSAGTVTITDNAGQQAKTGKDADTTVSSPMPSSASAFPCEKPFVPSSIQWDQSHRHDTSRPSAASQTHVPPTYRPQPFACNARIDAPYTRCKPQGSRYAPTPSAAVPAVRPHPEPCARRRRQCRAWA
ncbi:hypothetical protein [Ralstonia mojiangensis]|uniref:hypothetical protein n=1 Tax=Ralstonia mojiangensis TaxID=2953895 RepID=UPI0021B3447C|nr:hypothetical protein [Ralstonia mojiangensis]MCT7329106.1 hypothetical protein [Ralstonia mojiangensis]